MPRKYIDNIRIEDARIIFRNFRGQEGQYNREGDRSFSVVIEDADLAAKLIADGWNLKALRPRDEGDQLVYHLKVKVSFKNVQPTVYMVTSKGKTLLDEESIESLDYAEIRSVCVEIRPYHYEVRGEAGVSAYLKTLYVEIEEDPFADRYQFDEDENPWNE